ncbi:Hypothetical predicted protein [Mytilus galloprovincialis]|uniref:Uncharacterized protein n=1 Tax=Mytilus galloprovincialis TaxID=29158 RepID=A0A8B6GQI4_MYTGA|nr:Hypothetical predicted protein [Mytilus galloprovincialis]
MATEKTFRVSSVEYDKPTKLNNIDWANCILCQEIIDEKLICPFDYKRLNVGAGYQSLADNIKKFHELRLMPEGINVCIENLDEGSGIAQSFIDQKACWHKSCNLKLNRTKLDRAEKPTSHERIDNKATTSKKKTRHSFSVQSTNDIGPALKRFCLEDFNSKDIFASNSEFKGTFPKGYQEASVPKSLLTLVSMIQFWPNIQDRSYSQSTLTIAHLLMYSCTKKLSNRHMKDHEPPVCAYLGIMIHVRLANVI